RRRFRFEGVGVLTVAHLREDAARIRPGLYGGNLGDGAELHASGVGGVLSLPGWNRRGDEADRYDARRGDPQAIERQALGVGHLELGLYRAITRNVGG